MRTTVTMLLTLLAPPALAHDFWTSGEPVPPWVKRACCGPEEVHRIRADAVHLRADGYHIDGLRTVVPPERALPSPDGEYWGFWLPSAEPEPNIFCFFVPFKGL